MNDQHGGAAPGATKLFGPLCIPLALLLDGAFQASFGNTPGNALLGLRVVQLDGSPLGFMQQVWRIMAIQSQPMEYTDELVLKLTRKLWDTVAPVRPGAAP